MKKLLCAIAIVICLSSVSAQTDGTFPIIFKNLATETFADSQIYVYLIGSGGGMNFHVDKNGVAQPFKKSDNDAPGHITRNGQNFANYAVRLSDMVNFRSPAAIGGGRIYISLGAPLVLYISDNGYACPDPNNPGDPNNDVCYDWYEYCFEYKRIPFGGNTTQVDIFGFPMTVQLKQDSIKYDQTIGIPMARDKVIEYYNSHVSEPFKSIVGPNRIVAPRSAKNFGTGGTYATYMQPYIDSVWNYFSTNQFKWVRGNQTITGQVVNGVLQYTGGSMNKPTTNDIFACAGAFNGVLSADFSAAFNRGVAKFPADWYTPAKYYVNSQYKNEFAMVWHQLGLQNRAYGFAYDDVNDQSSVKILGNSNPPTSLTITIYPFKTVTAASIPVHGSAASQPAIRYGADNTIVVQGSTPIENVSLISLDGKSVLRNAEIGKNVIHTAGLAAGTYFVRKTDKLGQTSMTRFVKSK
jgi:hypothetical protein